MFNICIRMTGNQAEAEDLLQEAFLLAFKKIQQLKNPEQFGGWLRRIVVNECIRHSRKALKTTEWQEQYSESIADEETDWWTGIDLEMVHQEIKNLPAGCRQVFVLYVLEEYTHKEVAVSMGISEGTSKSQYQRARKILKQRIMQKLNAHG